MNGVTLEQRVGKFDIGHAEIGDGGADRHVRYLDADHEAEREQRVHQRLSPVGFGLAEMTVDVQRLRIERHVGEQHVVHLRHGARVSMLVCLADVEILEKETATFVPLDCFNHRFLQKILRLERFGNLLYYSFYHNSPCSACWPGTSASASSSLRRDLRKAQHDGRSYGYCQRGTTGDRGDPPGGAIDR